MARQSAIKLLRNQNTHWLIKRLVRDFARPYFSIMVGGFLCMVVVALMSVASAKLIEPIINDIFIERQADMLVPITVAIFLVFLLKGLATYGESVSLAYVSQKIIADIQKKMFAHVIECDLTFFHHTSTGELVSRFTNDINKLTTAVTGTLTNIGKDGLMLCAFIIFMFYQDWLLASISLFILPFAILPVMRIGKRMRKVSTNIQEQTARFTSLLTQGFQGIRLIKSYCMESHEIQQINKIIEEIFKRSFKASRVRAASHPIMEFLGGAAIAAVVIYGGAQVIGEKQNPGTFFSFITALLMMYEPLKRLANLNANLQDQLAAMTRVFHFLDLKSEIKEAADAKELKVEKGSIIFKDVSFSYDNHSVLKHINIDIPAGKMVALVGASGAGKSTLINLIPRFYDVSEGSILMDGIDIREVTLQSLRENVSLVSQEVILFDESIHTNISFGNRHASAQEVIKAAELAAAHEFIVELPQGYDTMVGEQGVRLSGGQRQRIAIARALLKNAPIILLDEPTSALDSASEQKVQQALKILMRDRTTVIIAHRLATVVEADIIFVLDQGKIIASGRHIDLIQNNRRYAQLCRAQLSSGIQT
jgi:subfamily B ATP-binding cassette protein MsbA